MKNEIFPLQFILYDSEADLPDSDKVLLEKATEAAHRAYAPYSEFKVGAALQLSNGVVVQGNNQENAAYPSGLCAERVALFYASSQYPSVAVDAIAITVRSPNGLLDKPIPPCGACRQVMAETQNRFQNKMRVVMRGQTGPILVVSDMSNLLPFTFSDKYLPKKRIK
jgi:cytidine deaminase